MDLNDLILGAYPSLAVIALGLVLIDLARVSAYEPRHARVEEARHAQE